MLKKSHAAVLVGAALVLSACGGGADASDERTSTRSVGIAMPTTSSTRWISDGKSMVDLFEAAGFTTDLQYGEDDVDSQVSQIQEMIDDDVSVIVVAAIDGTQLTGVLSQAEAAGIPVIAYDRLLTNTENVDYYVAYDNFQVGELQGQALLDGMKAVKPEGPYNIELFAGSPDDANAKVFFDGAMSILQPEIDNGNLVVVSGQETFDQAVTQGWKAENAQKRMDTLLSGNYGSTELDGVLSPNDTLARAILTSVEGAGKTLPVVTGQDSEVESVKLIMEGKQYSTINKDTRALVEHVIEMVGNLQAGEEVEINDPDSYDNGVKTVPAYLLEPQIVTKDNAADAYANNPTLSALTK